MNASEPRTLHPGFVPSGRKSKEDSDFRNRPGARGHVWGHGRALTACVLAVLLVLLPAAAGAQEPPPEEGPAAWELPVAAAAIAGANWLDVRSTQRLVAAGGVEAWSPGLYGPNAERIVPVRAAIVAGEVAAFHGLRKWRKEAAWAWVGVIVVGNVLLARRNARIIDRLEAGHPTPTAALPGLQISVSW